MCVGGGEGLRTGESLKDGPDHRLGQGPYLCMISCTRPLVLSIKAFHFAQVLPGPFLVARWDSAGFMNCLLKLIRSLNLLS